MLLPLLLILFSVAAIIDAIGNAEVAADARTASDTATVATAIDVNACVIHVTTVHLGATVVDTTIDDAPDGTPTVFADDAAYVASVTVVTATIDVVATVVITTTVYGTASGIATITDAVGTTDGIDAVVVAVSVTVAITGVVFVATFDASVTLVAMSSIDVYATIDRVVTIAVVTPVAAAFVTDRCDTGIATADDTGNDGHSTQLSRSA